LTKLELSFVLFVSKKGRVPNKATLELAGNISKLYKIQGIKIIKAKTIGNKTVQQKDISWSKRILGNEALAQINVKIIKELFNPKLKPYINPSKAGVFIISSTR